MKRKIFALIDCNNFYVSCERVFNPKIINKPTVVLSNNDGCIIARSQEVKDLGIQMGTPIFKIKELVEKEKINVYSANFPLYGDMSHRVMMCISEFVHDIEIYSIDEAFIELTNQKVNNVTNFCKELKNTIEKWTGIPVSIGVGCTKTLAKAANRLAKKKFRDIGVFNFFDYKGFDDEYLNLLEVSDLWGIGRAYSKFLNRHNILTAKDIKYLDLTYVKKALNINVERLILELKGVSCYSLLTHPKLKKNIAFTRTFGTYQKDFNNIKEAVSYFTRKIAEKLRKEKEFATYLQVFILTNFHDNKIDQYHNSIIIKLPIPTNNSIELIKNAIKGLSVIFKNGYLYKKAGVISLGLIPENHIQYDFFISESEFQKYNNRKLMNTMDIINKKINSDMAKFAIEGVKKEWWMNQTKKSKRYTSNWNELLQVK